MMTIYRTFGAYKHLLMYFFLKIHQIKMHNLYFILRRYVAGVLRLLLMITKDNKINLLSLLCIKVSILNNRKMKVS